MNTKQKLGYMVVGGALVAVGMAVALLMVSPVTAEKGFDLSGRLQKFGTIQCSRLEVVDADSPARVVLTIGDDGGLVYAMPKDGGGIVALNFDEHGGRVAARGKNGTQVTLGIHDHGGRIEVLGKGEGKVVMSINEYGNGAVSTYDNNGYLQ